MKNRFLRSVFAIISMLVLGVCACTPTDTAGTKPDPEPIPEPAVIESISVEGQKTEFLVGEEFSYDGLVVTATYSDLTQRRLYASEYSVDGLLVDTAKAGEYSVTVALIGTDVTTDYKVTVKAPAVVSSIAISGQKTEFLVGEEFSYEGLTVTATYSDGTERELNESEYSVNSKNYTEANVGEYEITVTTEGTDVKQTYTAKVVPSESLKLLMIGNSFSDDTIEYAYHIAKSVGVKEVVLGNMYIGGCSIATHYQNALNDSASYEYRTFDGAKWNTRYNTPLSYAIPDEDWDIITLQQASGYSGIGASLSDLDGLMYYVRSKATNKKVNLGWNMTWAYQANSNHSDFGKYLQDQTVMYNAIVDTVKNYVEKRDFTFVIPNGTAIQNARTSFVGDNLTRDGYHLSFDLGRYIAGLTLVGRLTGQDISKVTYTPDSMQPEYLGMAIESAVNALKNPYSVTNSVHTQKPAVNLPDLSNHEEIDYLPVGWAFWDATMANEYNTYRTTVKDLSDKFIATPRFTKETLPVGSYIVLQDGWQYRPEGWIGDVRQTSRPAITTKSVVEVTDAWWANFTYRAFNIAKVGTPTLEGKYEEVWEAFKIFVPKGTEKLGFDDFSSGDGALLGAKGVDISNMKRVRWVPINGYYNSGSSTSTLKMELVASGNALHTQFISTPTFNKTTLPVGSVIVLDSGWRYRPDAMTASGKPSVRPANVTENVVVVDEAWWSGYAVRGFNISTSEMKALNQNPYEAYSHLRIYVPKK